MGRIEVEAELVATPKHTWAVIAPIERHVEWMADAKAIRFVGDQRSGVGTVFLCDTRVGPLKLTDRMEITEWIPQEVMGVRHIGLVRGTGRFTLTPVDGGRRTRFVWSEDLKFPWWLGGVLAELLGGKLVLRFIWRRNLRALKRIVESTS